MGARTPRNGRLGTQSGQTPRTGILRTGEAGCNETWRPDQENTWGGGTHPAHRLRRLTFRTVPFRQRDRGGIQQGVGRDAVTDCDAECSYMRTGFRNLEAGGACERGSLQTRRVRRDFRSCGTPEGFWGAWELRYIPRQGYSRESEQAWATRGIGLTRWR